jgi:hypothetical protein
MPTADELLGIESPPKSQTVDEMLGIAKPPLTTAQRIWRGSAGSIIGGAAGGAAGAAAGVVAPPAAPALILGGTMLGSAAGEAVTQFVPSVREWAGGGPEGSLVQVVLAGTLPAVPAVARRFFLSLPGAAAGLQEFLFKRLGDKGQRVIAQFAPVAGTADDLFRQARASGAFNVPMPATTKVAHEISQEVGLSKFATGGAKTLAARAKEFVEPGAVSFDNFRLNQSDVGALVRSLDRKGGAALGRAKHLYAAMWDDLDTALAAQTAAGDPTGRTLRKAIDAFKREEAAKFVKDYWLRSVVRRVGQQNLDVDAFLMKIDRGRDSLEKLMPAGEVDDLIQTVKAFAKIPTMAKTPRLGFEQIPFAERAVVGGAVGAIAGAVTGGPGGELGGAAAGVLMVEAISSALSSAPGRALIRTLAEHGVGINQIGNVLLQGGRSTLAEHGVSMNQIGNVLLQGGLSAMTAATQVRLNTGGGAEVPAP